jgi:Spy/CpxP family protein refolding chaperone
MIRKTMLLLGFLAAFTAAASAQSTNGQANGQGQGQRQEKVAQELGLNADQKAQFFAANDAFRTEAQALRGNTSLSRDAKKAEIQKLAQTRDTKLQGFMTPDQYSKYKVMEQNAKEKAQENRGNGKGKGKGKNTAPADMPDDGGDKK